MIPTAQILAEAERRSWIEPQTLAVLTLAIDEQWTQIPDGFFQALDNQAHLTIDPWYNLAHLRGYPAGQWQDFKSLLYRHIRQAKDLYEGLVEEEPFMALTDAQQQKLLTDVAQLRVDVQHILDQLGPSLQGWPSLGKNSAGQELTWRDAFKVVKDQVAAIKTKLGA